MPRGSASLRAYHQKRNFTCTKEPRGKLAGYRHPEVGIHRGRLHLILYRAALARLGAAIKRN